MLRTTEAIPVFSELEGGSKEERSDGIIWGGHGPKMSQSDIGGGGGDTSFHPHKS